MKTCKGCRALEWPCFLVEGRCRMCQARRRDGLRGARGLDDDILKTGKVGMR